MIRSSLVACVLLTLTGHSLAGDCRVTGATNSLPHAAVAPLVAYPTVNYFVGRPVRIEAIAKKAIKDDPDYREFLEFKKWKAAQGTQKQNVTAPAAHQQTLLRTTCGKCHGGATPAGAFSFDGTHAITSDKFEQIIKWASGKVKPTGDTMPGVMEKLIKEKKTAQLLSELIDLQARKEDEE